MTTPKGIYIIKSTIDNRVYIGKYSRSSFQERVRLHKVYLRGNKHHSKKLQNFYNKYGKESLVFEILEEHTEAAESFINEREIHLNEVSGNLEVNKPLRISIDNIEYESLAHAQRELNYARATIRDRLDSERYPTWIRLERTDEYKNSGRKVSVTTIENTP